MNLYDLFQLDEGYTVTRGIDKDRYQERSGLEGPFQTKSGKVVYYDKKEGRYYDPDTDMYIDHEDYAALDEGDIERKSQRTARLVNLIKAKYPQADSELEAIVMHFTNDQVKDRSDINTLYRQNDEEEAEIEDIQAQLDKLKSRRAMGEAESNKEKAERAAMAKIQDQFKDLPKYTPRSAEQRAADAAQSKADDKQRAEQLAAYAEKLANEFDIDLGKGDTFVFLKGVKDGKNNYRDPKASDAHGPRTWAYDAGVNVGEQMRSPTNEDYYDTDEQRELARLGRIIMDMGAKRDDDIGAAMGAVGMELTKYGTPQGVSSVQKLEKVTGQPESVIMKMMALAQKVQGDVAVGDETAGEDEEIEEAKAKTNFDVEDLYKLQNINDLEKLKKNAFALISKPSAKPMKPEKVSWFERRLEQLTSKDSVMKLMWDLFMSGEGLAVQGSRYSTDKNYYRKTFGEADFDTNFKKRIGYTVKGGAASDMMKKQAAQAQQQNRELDPGAAEKGLGIGVLDVAKARKKAKEKGVRAPGSLRASPNTRDPKRLPEAESQMVRATLPNVLFDGARKLERLAKENDVEYSRQGRTVTLTGEQTNVRRIFFKMAYAPGNHPKMTPVNEAKDDIKIGDTVQTLKMGQMQGTVTGFSKKGGIDKVMFKHESGKTYATVPENLKVVGTKKSESLDDTVVEAKKKPVPTDPSKWSYYKSQAKKKFDVYPSAYANAWAAKQYKAAGGGWRMGKPKK